jgi:hypothetical protein
MIEALGISVLVSLVAWYYLDEEGNYSNGVCAFGGGVIQCFVCYICTQFALKATIRCAYKQRHTLKYSYKVA